MTADFFVGLAESPFLPEITYCEPKIVLFLFTEHFLFTPGKLYNVYLLMKISDIIIIPFDLQSANFH